jgi:hypothetical protein
MLIVLVAVSFTAIFVAKTPLLYLYFCCKILCGSVAGWKGGGVILK